jgi:RNA polymerase sigma-70 factor (ECF subfamily)
MLESPSHSDDDLLRLISKGQEAAFLQFYRKHQCAVYRFALHMSGKKEIAEEVTQDVFMTLIGVAKQYDSKRGSATSYLYGITRNFVLRCLERERPYAAALDNVESEQAGTLVSAPDLVGDLTRNERIESLRKAVLALRPERNGLRAGGGSARLCHRNHPVPPASRPRAAYGKDACR